MSDTDKPKPTSVEGFAAAKGTADWLVAAMRAKNRWGQGKELSEADYDKAVEETANLKYHAHPPAAPAPATATTAAVAPAALAEESSVIDDRPAKAKR